MKYSKLLEVVQKFKQYVQEASTACLSFRSIIDDCADKMKKLDKANSEYVMYYLHQMFTLYLGRKDEILVLINGDLRRSYHTQQFKNFVHMRSGERKNFRSDVILSACSCEGINFELREFENSGGSLTVSFLY